MQGWTGRPCPRCHGAGFRGDDCDDDTRPCEACLGSGREYGDLPSTDDHPPVKEPE
jgi:hypothetical protein